MWTTKGREVEVESEVSRLNKTLSKLGVTKRTRTARALRQSITIMPPFVRCCAAGLGKLEASCVHDSTDLRQLWQVYPVNWSVEWTSLIHEAMLWLHCLGYSRDSP